MLGLLPTLGLSLSAEAIRLGLAPRQTGEAAIRGVLDCHAHRVLAVLVGHVETALSRTLSRLSHVSLVPQRSKALSNTTVISSEREAEQQTRDMLACAHFKSWGESAAGTLSSDSSTCARHKHTRPMHLCMCPLEPRAGQKPHVHALLNRVQYVCRTVSPVILFTVHAMLQASNRCGHPHHPHACMHHAAPRTYTADVNKHQIAHDTQRAPTRNYA